MKYDIIKTENYLLVVDESEIKEGEYTYYPPPIGNGGIGKAIITQQGWNKNIIAHLPLNGSPILAGVDLLPVLEEDSIGWPLIHYINEKHNQDRVVGFCDGYNKAKEKYKYTEEDVIRIVEKSRATGLTAEYLMLTLSQPKMPIGFECEMEYKFPSGREWVQPNPDYLPKTTTTSEGHTQWVGTYIFN